MISRIGVGNTMKAIRYYKYGSTDVLELEDVNMPVVGDDDILVRVSAASVNVLDNALLMGLPYIMRGQAGLIRPKAKGLGMDMAGYVEAVGKNVTKFQPGDEVFGGGAGTFAEYVSVREDSAVLIKPANLTFEQAAAVPVAALTALLAVHHKGHIQPGQKVLVNGAAGGVGTFAVQIAKALGAEVTGVCSTPNVEMVRSIGADWVIDYTQEDFSRIGQRYDLLVDMVGNRSLSERRRVLAPKGILVAVGGPSKGRWIGPMADWVKMAVVSQIVSQSMVFFMLKLNREDLVMVNEFLEAGSVTPVVDRTYPLSDIAGAFRYFGTGHAKGKVVITM
jgi:NADPH:quinone reductase-like Zn-dependent oxidoreductase